MEYSPPGTSSVRHTCPGRPTGTVVAALSPLTVTVGKVDSWRVLFGKSATGRHTSATVFPGTVRFKANEHLLRANESATLPRIVGTVIAAAVNVEPGCGWTAIRRHARSNGRTPNSHCGIIRAGDALHGWLQLCPWWVLDVRFPPVFVPYQCSVVIVAFAASISRHDRWPSRTSTS